MLPLPKEPTRGDDVLEWARQTQRVLRSLRPASGPGIRITEGLNNFTISADPAKGGAPRAEIHPFMVLQRIKPGTEQNPTYQYGVVLDSSLYASLRPNHKYSPIEGLLSEDRSSGWFDLSSGGYIWLGITFSSNGSVTWAGIDNSDDDDFDLTQGAWSGENGYCEDDGSETNPVHQTSRKLIAYIVAGPSGDPVLHQVMRSDQLLRNVCIDGRPARYPFDHSGGYPL